MIGTPRFRLILVRNLSKRFAVIRTDFLVDDLLRWNELSRREQRILIKLFAGGSLRGEDPIDAADLMRLGLVTETGLTRAGLAAFVAAFKSQRDARGSGWPATVGAHRVLNNGAECP